MATTTTTQAERRFYSTRRGREAVRIAEAELPELELFQEEWTGAVLGGGGMPTGEPTREDGESHLEAWKRLLRGDPCAFCGARMLPCAWTPTGATVDHIVPRARGERYRERWTNFTGACLSCNGSKRDSHLLRWMLARKG